MSVSLTDWSRHHWRLRVWAIIVIATSANAGLLGIYVYIDLLASMISIIIGTLYH